MIPASGSAYTYTYVVIGELLAWIVGWSLILEYSLVVSAVAVGWSGYAVGFMDHSMISWLPAQSSDSLRWPRAGRSAASSTFRPSSSSRVVAGTADLRHRESATVNAILVLVKIVALIVFVAVALPYFNARQFPSVHALRLPQGGQPRRRRTWRDGGGRDHLLRLLRLRRDRDRRGGDEESRPRPVDRHRRLDGALRDHLHGGGRQRRSARSPTAASPTAPSRSP